MKIFRRFIQYYKPYRSAFFIDMFCATLVSVVDLSVPLIINYLVRDVYPMPDTAMLTRLAVRTLAMMAALYLIRFFAQYYITSWGHIMGARMEGDMRSDLFSHMEKLSFSYYDKNNTGKMMSRIVSDLFDISELAHHGPEDIFISLVKLIGSFAILTSLNATVSMVLLAVTLAMLVFSLYYNKHMRRVFMDNRRKIADVNAIVQDSLSGIRTVKSFSNEDTEQAKFERGNHQFFLSRKANYLTMGRYFSMNSLMQGIMYLAVLGTGGWMVANRGMDAGIIILYVLYIGMFLDPINRLINFTEQFQKGFTGFERMVEILDTDPDVQDRPGAVDCGTLKGEIRFDNVSFGYEQDKPVLQNLNLTIPAGRNVALVGPSGTGKTTFCSLIPRFYDVTEGAVSVDGRDVRDMTMKSLRRNIGVVQQDVYVFNSTVRENIAYGKPDATDEEIIEAAKKANIHDFIMGLEQGYDTQVGERGVRFSGGQKQRLSIARVFLKNPPILILDEATSALDNENERFIQHSLDELSKNRTTIVIAHRLSTIRSADEILILTENGVAERGAHEELMRRNGLYARLYNMQFEGIQK